MIEHKTQMQPTAKQIIGYLDKFVIGQDYAKQVLANVVANRLKSEMHMQTTKNVLLYGPSGSGKTLMINKLTEFVQVGYIRISAVNLMESTIEQCLHIVNKNQHTLVLIDDIDLFCISHTHLHEMLIAQKRLVDLLDGKMIFNKFDQQQFKKVIFVCAGTFSNASLNKLIPALQAQFPARAELNMLDQFELLNILHLDSNNYVLGDYIKLFQMNQIKLMFEDCALMELARLAFIYNQKEQNIGIKRLNLMLEELFKPILLNVENYMGNELIIDIKYVQNMFIQPTQTIDYNNYIL